jgi:hypothetical protein
MKIRAGWKFQPRKPRQAPATAADSTAVVPRSSETARIAKVPAAIAQSPAASPSRPSMKLTTLAIATMNSTVTGAAAAPRSTAPTSGAVNRSIVTPSRIGSSAHPICPTSLTAGDSCTASSTAPSRHISTPPIRMAVKVSFSGRFGAVATSTPATIPTPPRSGTGRVWMRRPPGWSTTPRPRASSIASGVPIRPTKPSASTNA